MPPGFNPLLSVWRVAGREFTPRGTGDQVLGSVVADTVHRLQEPHVSGARTGKWPGARGCREALSTAPPWVSGGSKDE